MDPHLQELDDLLSEPLESVRERERSSFDRLLAERHGQLVLFGAGTLGRKALACLRGSGVEPLAFADNASAKWGTQVDGLTILSPRDAAETYGPSALFVVTIWSLGHSFTDTRAKLGSLGCPHVTSSSSLRWKFAAQMLPDYCCDLPHKLYEQSDDVRRAASLWADDYSRREYLNHLKWRALGDLGALSAPVSEESYFLDSLYHMTPGEVFLDCGAYDGDTIRQLVLRNNKFKRVFAVEADPSNFRRLSAWVESLDSDIARRIEPINTAVSARPGRLHFHATGAEGAHLADDGEIVVDCVRIDDLVAKSEPTFIKMDIEGAEIDALQGANKAIKRRPLLSICVYHRQNDLWRIPLFIHSVVPDYKFFLRPHDVDGWQLVCYAVPTTRLRA
jgi:FkbM family methyltransferase